MGKASFRTRPEKLEATPREEGRAKSGSVNTVRTAMIAVLTGKR